MTLHISKWFNATLFSATYTVLLLGGYSTCWAQGTTVSSNPLNGTINVSPTAPLILTFSGPMDPSSTMVNMLSTSPFAIYNFTTNWSSGNTVMTCTPSPALPSNVTITWAVQGTDAGGGSVMGFGSFTTGTGSGGGGTGSGTNIITTFSVSKLYLFEQLTTNAATPTTFAPYIFGATTSLSSNRAATSVTVTVPVSAAVKGLAQDPTKHEDYSFQDFNTVQATFESTYPQGDYTYNVTGTPANLQAVDTLPTAMTQPNVPHVSNFAAAQAVDPTQAFTVKWDPYQASGTGSNFIALVVNNEQGTVLFESPTNGLPATTTSITIPPNTLSANTTNPAVLSFYSVVTSSNSTYATVGVRASATQFDILTKGGGSVAPAPVVSNPSWGSNGFGFDVSTAQNQVLKVLYSPDCSQPINQWQLILTTNAPAANFHLVPPQQTGANGFFRLMNGP